MLSENQKKKFSLDLKAASNLGTNIIVAWRPLASGILLFQIPIYEIATRSALLLERLSADDHRIGDADTEALKKIRDASPRKYRCLLRCPSMCASLGLWRS
jgi:hypothetical protein